MKIPIGYTVDTSSGQWYFNVGGGLLDPATSPSINATVAVDFAWKESGGRTTSYYGVDVDNDPYDLVQYAIEVVGNSSIPAGALADFEYIGTSAISSSFRRQANLGYGDVDILTSLASVVLLGSDQTPYGIGLVGLIGNGGNWVPTRVKHESFGGLHSFPINTPLATDVTAKCLVPKPLVITYTDTWSQYRGYQRPEWCIPYAYTPDHVDTSITNVVIYSFYAVLPNGTITNVEADDVTLLPKLAAKKQNNTDLKILISIGGWNFCAGTIPSPAFNGSDKWFPTVASNASLIEAFAESAVALCKQYNVDGIDIDWEATVQDHAEHYLNMLRGLHTVLSANNLILTVAAPAGQPTYTRLNLAELGKAVDMVHLMTYDYFGAFPPFYDQPNAPMITCSLPANTTAWDIRSSVRDYLGAGIPRSKMAVGLATYGRTTNATLQGDCSMTWGVLQYYEILHLLGPNTTLPSPDPLTMSVSTTYQGSYIGFDNAESLRLKICFL
ncbi:hypothetical protein HDU76_010470, partial [Blyttiomyces sp. JEL0837]